MFLSFSATLFAGQQTQCTVTVKDSSGAATYVALSRLSKSVTGEGNGILSAFSPASSTPTAIADGYARQFVFNYTAPATAIGVNRIDSIVLKIDEDEAKLMFGSPFNITILKGASLAV